MMTDQERLDDLLASSLAHQIIFHELARAIFGEDRERFHEARNRACLVFEEAYNHVSSGDERAHLNFQKAIGLIESVFRGPLVAPERPEPEAR